MSEKSIWSREHPKPPNKGQNSKFYWLHKDGENQPIISEVWPDRSWWSSGWWGPQVILPKEKIPNE